ncbi:MAG: TIGR04086 family membrane protein [Ruminococcus sp.]|nr:TIGR04086 family membrane protein [Ruminococcus sp.]MDE7099318.1 TIGR04086 family membrane protein [Ruminococcus sp.]
MDNDEMLKNLKLMKQCKKIDDKVSTIYIVSCGLYALGALFLTFLGLNEGFINFFDSVIVKLVILASGYFACYKHNNKFLLFSLGISAVSILLSTVNILITIVVIILSVITVMNNKTYHYLEKQTGFPYFSERFEMQNIDTKQREIKDKYQQKYEQYNKNSSDEMNDIDLSYRPVNSGTNEFDNSGKMDEI